MKPKSKPAPCDECAAAREFKEFNWTRYDAFACVWCCARLIQAIAHHPIAKPEISARRTALITEAADRGLDAELIRKLAAGALALQPPPEKEKKK